MPGVYSMQPQRLSRVRERCRASPRVRRRGSASARSTPASRGDAADAARQEQRFPASALKHIRPPDQEYSVVKERRRAPLPMLALVRAKCAKRAPPGAKTLIAACKYPSGATDFKECVVRSWRTALSGGASASAGGPPASTGGTSASTGGTSASTRETSARSGGTSAGSNEASAGSNQSSAGTGGSSALPRETPARQGGCFASAGG